jgi:hypothetical protein
LQNIPLEVQGTSNQLALVVRQYASWRWLFGNTPAGAGCSAIRQLALVVRQ